MLRAGGVRLLLIAILALLACAPAAAACVPDSGPNLSGRVVTNAALTNYSSLECANFQHADLRGVSFLQADLKTADFRFAIVTGDDFSQATLQEANFYSAQAARANFGQAMMQYANLRDANLQGADFIQTYLEHATLNGATNTSGADFTQADTYDSTGIPSNSGSGGFAVIILIAVGLLIAVPILISVWKTSKSKSSSIVTVGRVRGGTSATVSHDSYATPSSLLPDTAHASARDGGGDGGSDEITELETLDQMRKSGNLSEDEFNAAKKRILGET